MPIGGFSPNLLRLRMLSGNQSCAACRRRYLVWFPRSFCLPRHPGQEFNQFMICIRGANLQPVSHAHAIGIAQEIVWKERVKVHVIDAINQVGACTLRKELHEELGGIMTSQFVFHAPPSKAGGVTLGQSNGSIQGTCARADSSSR